MIEQLQHSLYYEAHVTIDPVIDDELEKFKELCKQHKFRVAELLMKKKKSKTGFVLNDHDQFCTGRDLDAKELCKRMFDLIKNLELNGFTVRRYKVENTLLDKKINC